LLGTKQQFFCTLDLLQASACASLLPTINMWQSPLQTYLQHAIYHVIQAMDELDNSCAFSKRLYVPPTYAELRKIINIAQVEPPSASSCCPPHTTRSPSRVIPALQPVALVL
jgi:hypothetical protein